MRRSDWQLVFVGGASAYALLLAMLLASATNAADSPADVPLASRPILERTISNFQARDFRGKETSLTDFAESKLLVVAFLGTECPLAKSYAARLERVRKEYAERGVAFVGVMANRQDSISDIAAFARDQAVEYPLLKDVDGSLAAMFSAVRTPEVFLLDSERHVRYYGRVDDQYGVGYQRAGADKKYLAAAIEDLLAGREVADKHVQAVGCRIGLPRKPKPDAPVTYSKQIARIFQNRCIECHREGQIAPFALTSYEEAAGWAETIEEVVSAQRMPPWLANPKYGHFKNDTRLPQEEKDQIYQWVRDGAPEGDQSELPEPKKFNEGWRMGKVDREIFIDDKPFEVPATGEVRYQYFAVDPGFTEDMWVQAAECKPGNRSVVHHIILLVQPPGGGRRGEVASDWLTATAPGAQPLVLPDGLAKFVPAGSKLIFQIHYTPNGVAQQDRSSVGLRFCDAKTVRKEIGTWRAAENDFVIPPGAANHKVEAWHTFAADTLLLAMFPHMHLRGKSFRYEAVYPDGTSEVLLDVPHYDFGWQLVYVLDQPKVMPAGSKLHCTAHFDNSRDNLANPDPTKRVRWGDQTWEEMMIGYFEQALVEQDLQQGPTRTRADKFVAEVGKNQSAVDDELRTLAGKALASHDDFVAFAHQVEKRLPMVDRVCLQSVNDGRMKTNECTHAPQFSQYDRGRGRDFPAQGLTLAGYATNQRCAVNQSFADIKTPDFALLGRLLASSMHEPLQYNGAPAVLSFWSRDSKAFPPEVQAAVKELTKLVIGATDEASTDAK